MEKNTISFTPLTKSFHYENLKELSHKNKWRQMELVGKLDLRKDVVKHSDAKLTIEAWIQVVEEAKWDNLMMVKETYRSADYVKGKTVFNIKGNKYRLITIIDYSLQLIVYERFLTHAEYDKYEF